MMGAFDSYIAFCEVTTLEHELRDDSMEAGALVSKPLLTRAQSTEIRGRLGDDIVEEVKDYATGRS